MNTSNFLKIIFDYLNEHIQYAVLRNYENLPQKPSRDIDLIVNKSSFLNKKDNFIRLFLNNGYCLLQKYEGSEMTTLVFASYDKGLHVISFDFLFSIYVRNLVLLKSQEVLSTRIFNGKLYHVRKDMEFLSKYMYNLILGESYPQKYNHIKQEAYTSYRKEIYSHLRRLGLNDEGKPLHVKKIMWSKYFFRTFFSTNRYYKRTIYNLFNPQGFSIGFTGPDGSGKTTIINTLVAELNTIYKKIPLYHFRPTMFGNIGDVAHAAGLKKEVDHNFNKPHRGVRTSIISSLCRLVYYTNDYILGYICKIHRELFKRNIIIFDRYFTDIICDSRRSRIYLGPKFLYLWNKCFIPTLDYNILLTANAYTILSRKNELDEEGIRSINSKIDYLANKKGYIKILNETTPQDTIAQILTYIFEEQNKKNLKRLR